MMLLIEFRVFMDEVRMIWWCCRSSSLHPQIYDPQSITSSNDPHFIHKNTTLAQQHYQIILTSSTNTRHSTNNIIRSSSLHPQTHETQSITSSDHPHFIRKDKILAQRLHQIILASSTNTRNSINNIIRSSSLYTQRHDTQSTTSSENPHFIQKHMTLNL